MSDGINVVTCGEPRVELVAVIQPWYQAIEIDRSKAEPVDSEGNRDLRAVSLEVRSQELQVH
jgi:hypothetical protein